MTPAGLGIRALVVDDEPLARSNLTGLLRRDADIVSVQECESGAAALKEIRAGRTDLVFLDVQMPECGGFDVVESLQGETMPVIVFVTAYDQYALRAFDAGALDYLLKPFDDARFQLALERAKENVARRQRAEPELAPQRLVIKGAGAVTFVQVADIDWIEAADYYVCLHVGAKSHLLRRSLADLGKDLQPELFCRIHRSTIVNLSRVKRLEVDATGEYQVILDSGEKLRLSRSFRKELQLRLGARGRGALSRDAR
jgi:two-component system, LytTR family, response regulator